MVYFMRIYLYLLIGSSLLFILLYALIWLIRRQPVLQPKQIWRNILFLINGIISLAIFNSGVFNIWVVWLITIALLFGSVYALEAMERRRTVSGGNHRAT